MKLIGTTATPEDHFATIAVDAADYWTAKDDLFAQVPAGAQLVSIRVERG